MYFIRCQHYCAGQDFIYSGVQYKTQCFCGNDNPADTSKAPASECNLACSGDSTKMCGGSWRMNIYRSGNQQRPKPKPQGEEGRIRLHHEEVSSLVKYLILPVFFAGAYKNVGKQGNQGTKQGRKPRTSKGRKGRKRLKERSCFVNT